MEGFAIVFFGLCGALVILALYWVYTDSREERVKAEAKAEADAEARDLAEESCRRVVVGLDGALACLTYKEGPCKRTSFFVLYDLLEKYSNGLCFPHEQALVEAIDEAIEIQSPLYASPHEAVVQLKETLFKLSTGKMGVFPCHTEARLKIVWLKVFLTNLLNAL